MTTTATAAPVSAATHPSITWIRPWYPAGHMGHIYDDCELLLRWESEPQEGAGWLDPNGRDVCRPCLKRHQNGGAQ
jgi:hypothetical protein